MKILCSWPNWTSDRNGRRLALMLIAAIATPFLVANIVSVWRQAGMRSVAVPSSPHTEARLHSASGERQGGEILARLENYARSIEAEKPASPAVQRELLPNVNTMIDRLAARLEASPGDATGWRMLGWSNFYLERYGEAAVAYARALELEPTSEELKRSYEEAVARASRPLDP